MNYYTVALKIHRKTGFNTSNCEALIQSINELGDCLISSCDKKSHRLFFYQNREVLVLVSTGIWPATIKACRDTDFIQL